jgi:two-component system phosphate regulon sensor histidine kinase PhoR
MTLETILGWLAAVAAVAFFVLWRRALASKVDAERTAAHGERAAQETRQTAAQNAAYLAALQLAQTEAVLLISPSGTVLSCNPAATALFGPLSTPGQTLILLTRSTELDQLMTRALAGETDCDQQVTLTNEAQPYRARAIRAGEFGAVLVLQDLSTVQRLGRARRDFVANISHELRTPLTSIRLLIESLQSGVVKSPDDYPAIFQKINTEVRVLEQMAQELLDLAQIESGQAIVRLVSTPLQGLVAQTVEHFEPQAAHKQQKIYMEVPPDLVVLADAEKLSRALGNLVHNALKFTPEQGKIWVRAVPDNGDVQVEVADTGIGIPPEDLPRVFERFYRGDRSRTSGGTGLGLAIAKHVIEAHGGKIWVESTGRPGQGAIFRFTLLADH